MIKNINKNEKLHLSKDKFELVFEDNFEFIDKTKWLVCPDSCLSSGAPGARRAAFYTDDSDILFIKDNKLYIRTMWKNGKFGEGFYTSWLESSINRSTTIKPQNYNGFSTKFGYFECRCKPSKAFGIWSAFWLMPDNDIAFSENDIQNSGEDGIEIDIMESPFTYKLTERGKNVNIHVLHADGYDKRLKSSQSPAYHIPKMYDEFHTYGLLWEEDKYTFFVDGYKTWETTHVYQNIEMGTSKVPEYMVLSTEVAGSAEDGKLYPGLVRNENGEWEKFWNGNPDKNDKSKNYDFIVDYVRVYKIK